tara:strand:+ start:5052 stop:5309 length:258 start_codon:yes stop_codon:yes gene_type:complete
MRKKVETGEVTKTTPKKRVKKTTTKKEPTIRWDKIEGVKGKIVRHTMEDSVTSKEMSELVANNKAKRLYCATDGDDFYFYYELLK